MPHIRQQRRAKGRRAGVFRPQAAGVSCLRLPALRHFSQAFPVLAIDRKDTLKQGERPWIVASS